MRIGGGGGRTGLAHDLSLVLRDGVVYLDTVGGGAMIPDEGEV